MSRHAISVVISLVLTALLILICLNVTQHPQLKSMVKGGLILGFPVIIIIFGLIYVAALKIIGASEQNPIAIKIQNYLRIKETKKMPWLCQDCGSLNQNGLLQCKCGNAFDEETHFDTAPQVASQTTDTWLNKMDGGEPLLRYSNCKKSFDDNQASPEIPNKERANWNFNITFFITVFILLALMIYLNRTFSVLTLKENSGQIIYEILIIIIISSSVASGKIRQNLKYLTIWAGIILIMITVYSYRHELSGIKDKILSEIIPSRGLKKEPNSISFPVSSDGHFHIRAEVNGIPVIFLADTGASHIVLSPADATKIGINTDELRFDRFYETANGTVRGSSFKIDNLQIGEFHLKEIWASVNEADMQGSLLGMNFFKRLRRFEVKNDVLTLYWSD